MKSNNNTKENNSNENIIKFKKEKTNMYKEKDQKALKKIFINLIIAIFVMLYLVGINLVYGQVQQEGIITVLKISTLLFLAVGLILIELAYKKESGLLLINAIEALIFAIHHLTTMHTIRLYNFDFKMYILTSSYIFSIYYVLKTIIIYTKEKRDYLKSLSDIKDIVKKDEPLKKEATKKSKKEEIVENKNTKPVIAKLENSKKTSKKSDNKSNKKEKNQIENKPKKRGRPKKEVKVND